MIQIDTIGIMHTPGTYDAAGEVITAPVALAGYHVNASAPVADWAEHKVTPATPRRVFGGVETHFYTFSDQAAYELLLETADLSTPVVPAPLPSITMRQAVIALEMAGLLVDVEALVATLPRIYQLEWERASVVLRDNPLVEMVRQQKGMTHAQIDALFLTADAL